MLGICTSKINLLTTVKTMKNKFVGKGSSKSRLVWITPRPAANAEDFLQRGNKQLQRRNLTYINHVILIVTSRPRPLFQNPEDVLGLKVLRKS